METGIIAALFRRCRGFAPRAAAPTLCAAVLSAFALASVLFAVSADEARAHSATPHATLPFAARDGDWDVVNHFIAEHDRAALNVQHSTGDTPLNFAANSGHISIALTLIALSVSVNVPNIEKLTPLHGAALHGSIPLAEALISAGASVNATLKESGRTPLAYAGVNDKTAIFPVLIAAGAHWGEPCESGEAVSTIPKAGTDPYPPSPPCVADPKEKCELANWGYTAVLETCNISSYVGTDPANAGYSNCQTPDTPANLGFVTPLCSDAFGANFDFPTQPTTGNTSPYYPYNCDPDGTRGLIPATANTIGATECACADAGKTKVGGSQVGVGGSTVTVTAGGICVPTALAVGAQKCLDAGRTFSEEDGGTCGVAITLSGGTVYGKCHLSGSDSPQCADVFGADLKFPPASTDGPFIYNCDLAGNAELFPATVNTIGATECSCPSGKILEGGVCAACPVGQGVLDDGTCGACPAGRILEGGVCVSANASDRCTAANWRLQPTVKTCILNFYEGTSANTGHADCRTPETPNGRVTHLPFCADVFGPNFDFPTKPTTGDTSPYYPYNCDPDGTRGLIPATANTIGATECVCADADEVRIGGREADVGRDGTAVTAIIGGNCIPAAIGVGAQKCLDAGRDFFEEDGGTCGVAITRFGGTFYDKCHLSGADLPQCADVFGADLNFPTAAIGGPFVYDCDPDGNAGLIPATMNTIGATECACPVGQELSGGICGTPPLATEVEKVSPNLATIRALLDAGANPAVTAAGGWPLIFTAVDQGHAEVISILITAGAHPETRHDFVKVPGFPLSISIPERIIRVSRSGRDVGNTAQMMIHFAEAVKVAAATSTVAFQWDDFQRFEEGLFILAQQAYTRADPARKEELSFVGGYMLEQGAQCTGINSDTPEHAALCLSRRSCELSGSSAAFVSSCGACAGSPLRSVDGGSCVAACGGGQFTGDAAGWGERQCQCADGEVVIGGSCVLSAVAAEARLCAGAGWPVSPAGDGACETPVTGSGGSDSPRCHLTGSDSPQCSAVFGATVNYFPAPVTSSVGATLSFVYNCDPGGTIGLIPATVNTIGATECACTDPKHAVQSGICAACPVGQGVRPDKTCGVCPAGRVLDDGICVIDPVIVAAANAALLAEVGKTSPDLAAVRRALDTGADANITTSAGVPALVVAALGLHAEVISVLITAGADPSVKVAGIWEIDYNPTTLPAFIPAALVERAYEDFGSADALGRRLAEALIHFGDAAGDKFDWGATDRSGPSGLSAGTFTYTAGELVLGFLWTFRSDQNWDNTPEASFAETLGRYVREKRGASCPGDFYSLTVDSESNICASDLTCSSPVSGKTYSCSRECAGLPLRSLDGGSCVAECGEIEEADATAWPDTQCVCPGGTVPEDGACSACPAGQGTLADGTCGVCPGGEGVLVDGNCGVCPAGRGVLDDGVCGVCPDGEGVRADNGRCAPPLFVTRAGSGAVAIMTGGKTMESGGGVVSGRRVTIVATPGGPAYHVSDWSGPCAAAPKGADDGERTCAFTFSEENSQVTVTFAPGRLAPHVPAVGNIPDQILSGSVGGQRPLDYYCGIFGGVTVAAQAVRADGSTVNYTRCKLLGDSVSDEAVRTCRPSDNSAVAALAAEPTCTSRFNFIRDCNAENKRSRDNNFDGCGGGCNAGAGRAAQGRVCVTHADQCASSSVCSPNASCSDPDIRVSHAPTEICTCDAGYTGDGAFCGSVIDSNLLTEVKKSSPSLVSVRALLGQGADPDIADGDGIPLLFVAGKMGHAEIVSVLVAAGADYYARVGTDYFPEYMAFNGLTGDPATAEPNTSWRNAAEAVIQFGDTAYFYDWANTRGAYHALAHMRHRYNNFNSIQSNEDAKHAAEVMAGYMLDQGIGCPGGYGGHAICNSRPTCSSAASGKVYSCSECPGFPHSSADGQSCVQCGAGGILDNNAWPAPRCQCADGGSPVNGVCSSIIDLTLVAEIKKTNPVLSSVQSLLDQNADPNWTSGGDLPPLLIAARMGHAEIVSVLVTAGADVNATDSTFYDLDAVQHATTPLTDPAVGTRALRASVLYHFGAALDVRNMTHQDANFDWNRSDRNGNHALDILRLAKDKNPRPSGEDENIIHAMADYMLARGANCKTTSDKTRRICAGNAQITSARAALTAELNKARGVAKVSVVLRLLDADGAHPDMADSNGRPLLILAAIKGHEAIVSALVTFGANPDARLPGSGNNPGLGVPHVVAKNNYPPGGLYYAWRTGEHIMRHFADALDAVGAAYDWNTLGGGMRPLEYLRAGYDHGSNAAKWPGEWNTLKWKAIRDIRDVIVAAGGSCRDAPAWGHSNHVTCVRSAAPETETETDTDMEADTAAAAVSLIAAVTNTATSAGEVSAAGRAALDAGVDLDDIHNGGAGPHILALAAQSGHAAAVSVLLTLGAAADGRDLDNRTVPHLAAVNSDASAPLQARILRHFIGGLHAAGKTDSFNGWNDDTRNVGRPLDMLRVRAAESAADLAAKRDIHSLLYERGARCEDTISGSVYCEVPSESAAVPADAPATGGVLTVRARDFGGTEFGFQLPDADIIATLTARGWEIGFASGVPRGAVLSRTRPPQPGDALPDFFVNMLRLPDQEVVRKFNVGGEFSLVSLFVTSGGSGSFAATADGSPIESGEAVLPGQYVRIVATPSRDSYHVSDWSGPCADSPKGADGGERICEFVFNGEDNRVSVTFSPGRLAPHLPAFGDVPDQFFNGVMLGGKNLLRYYCEFFGGVVQRTFTLANGSFVFYTRCLSLGSHRCLPSDNTQLAPHLGFPTCTSHFNIMRDCNARNFLPHNDHFNSCGEPCDADAGEVAHGRVCVTPGDQCAPPFPSVCSANASCSDPNLRSGQGPRQLCTCNEGYVGDGAFCGESESVSLVAEVRKPLEEASVSVVLSLLAAGASPDAVDESGVPVLIEAARMGHVEILSILVTFGADPDARLPNGWGVPHVAAINDFVGSAPLHYSWGTALNVLRHFAGALDVSGAAYDWNALGGGHRAVEFLRYRYINDAAVWNEAGEEESFAEKHAAMRKMGDFIRARGGFCRKTPAYSHPGHITCVGELGVTLAAAAASGDAEQVRRAAQAVADIGHNVEDYAHDNGGALIVEAATRSHAEAVSVLLTFNVDPDGRRNNRAVLHLLGWVSDTNASSRLRVLRHFIGGLEAAGKLESFDGWNSHVANVGGSPLDALQSRGTGGPAEDEPIRREMQRLMWEGGARCVNPGDKKYCQVPRVERLVRGYSVGGGLTVSGRSFRGTVYRYFSPPTRLNADLAGVGWRAELESPTRLAVVRTRNPLMSDPATVFALTARARGEEVLAYDLKIVALTTLGYQFLPLDERWGEGSIEGPVVGGDFAYPGSRVTFVAEPTPGRDVFSWELDGADCPRGARRCGAEVPESGLRATVRFASLAGQARYGEIPEDKSGGTLAALGLGGNNGIFVGATVTFVATPAEGWTIAAWEGDAEGCSALEHECALTTSRHLHVTARFAVNPAIFLEREILKPSPDLATVRHFLEIGADPDNAPGGVPLLVVAATLGHAEIVSVLVTFGADPDARLPNGENPTRAVPHLAVINDYGSLPLYYSWGTALKVLRHFADAVNQAGATYNWTSNGAGPYRAIEHLRHRYIRNHSLSGALWPGESEAEKKAAMVKMADILLAQGDFCQNNRSWKNHITCKGSAKILTEVKKPNASAAAVVGHLNDGADPNIADSDGVAALIIAATMGHADIVSVLITAGADADTRGNNERGVPHLAAVNNFGVALNYSWGTALKVLRHFADAVNQSGAAYDWTAQDDTDFRAVEHLNYRYNAVGASWSGESQAEKNMAMVRMADILLAQGDSCSGRDWNNHITCQGSQGTLLPEVKKATGAADAAAVAGHLNAGADPDIADSDGIPALIIAATLGRAEIVSVLVTAGADANTRDSDGNAVPHIAAINSFGSAPLHYSWGTALKVLRHFADAVNQSGATYDWTSTRSNGYRAIELLKHRYSADAAVWDGESAAEKQAAIVRMANILLAQGDSCQSSRDFADHVTCQGSGQELLAEVQKPAGEASVSAAVTHLNNGADPDIADSDGIPALIIAATLGHAEIVSVLVTAGADVNATDPEFYNVDVVQHAATPLTDPAAGPRSLRASVLYYFSGALDVRNALFGDANFAWNRQDINENRAMDILVLAKNKNPRPDGEDADIIHEMADYLFDKGARCGGKTADHSRRICLGAVGASLGASLIAEAQKPAGEASVSVILTLLERSANPSVKDSNGAPALLVAASRGHAEIVSVLVTAGADVNARDSDGNAVPHIVAINSFGSYPLHYSWGAALNVLRHFADAVNQSGAAYNWTSTRNNGLRAVEMLEYRYSAAAAVWNGNAVWPAESAAEKQTAMARMANLMLAEGDSCLPARNWKNHITCQGSKAALLTEVQKARGAASAAAVAEHLNNGADPNIADSDGVAALIIAATLGHAEIVSVLVTAGANVTVTDADFDNLDVVQHAATPLTDPAAGPRSLRASVLYYFGGALDVRNAMFGDAEFNWNRADNGNRALEILANAEDATPRPDGEDADIIHEMSDYMLGRGAECGSGKANAFKYRRVCIGTLGTALAARVYRINDASAAQTRELAQAMVDAGINPDIAGGVDGHTADGHVLALAAQRRNAAAVSVLLTFGVNPDAALGNGRGVLHIVGRNVPAAGPAMQLDILRHFVGGLKVAGRLDSFGGWNRIATGVTPLRILNNYAQKPNPRVEEREMQRLLYEAGGRCNGSGIYCNVPRESLLAAAYSAGDGLTVRGRDFRGTVFVYSAPSAELNVSLAASGWRATLESSGEEFVILRTRQQSSLDASAAFTVTARARGRADVVRLYDVEAAVSSVGLTYATVPNNGSMGVLTVSGEGLIGTDAVYAGSRITFTATPEPEHGVFAWEGDGVNCPQEALKCVVAATPGSDLAVTARFARTYPAGYAEIPDDKRGGTLTAEGLVGEDRVFSGVTVVFRARPTPGWFRDAWKGDGAGCLPSDPECVLTAGVDGLFVTVQFVQALLVEYQADPPDKRGGTLTATGLAGENAVFGGARATFTASPAYGWFLAAWEGDIGSCAAPDLECVLTVSADARVTARFSPEPRVAAAHTPPDGSGGRVTIAGVAGSADGEDFVYSGGTVTFTATPEFGWELSAWEGDVGSCAAPDLECVLTVSADARVTALFSPAPRVEVTLTPPDGSGGRVTIAGVAGNADGEDFVYSGGRATFTAAPTHGWELSAWEGDVGSCAAPDLECVLTVSADARVTALFSPAPRVEVTLAPPDGSGGRVTIAGVDGNADGEDFVYSGGRATFTAVPTHGWELSAWEGDVGSCAAPDLECVLTVNADARVTALFSQTPRVEVALNPPNAAGGRVTIAGVDGNADGKDFVYSGGTATLTAIPEFGWELSAWEGDVGGSGGSCAAPDLECVLTVSADVRVTAHFSRAPRVEAESNPSKASGRVTIAGADGNAGGEDFVFSGGLATWTAAPAHGWELSAWGGDAGSCAAPDLECVLTVSADVRVTALFSPAPRVAAASNPSDESGRVAIAGVDGNAGGEDFVYSGGTVTWTATPALGWELSAWEGDAGNCAAPDLECVLTVSADARVAALFSPAPRVAAASSPSDESGRVTIAGVDGNAGGEDFVYSGGTVTFTAIPKFGWKFSAWEGDVGGSGGSCAAPALECVLTVSADVRVTASFSRSCAGQNRRDGDDSEGCGNCLDTYKELSGPGSLCVKGEGDYYGNIPQDVLCRALRGDPEDAQLAGNGRVCSGVDANGTFCILNSVDGLPCRGLFRHVLKCNMQFKRKALNPFFCGEACEDPSKSPVGKTCRSVAPGGSP